MNPASPIHRRIVAARRAVLLAQDEYEFVLEAVQRACRHADLVEWPGRDGVLGYQMPRRLCRRCKLEEEAWGWGPNSMTTWCSDGSEPGRVRLTGDAATVSSERYRECREE